MQPKAIPAPGSWGTKKAKPDDEPVLFQVTAVDPVKEHLTYQRFVRYLDGGVPLFGRKSTLDFKTWQTNRYHPCEAPPVPVPEMLDREQAEKRLLDDGADPEWIADVMREPRVALAWIADTPLSIALRAHVRWLDAQVAPPVAAVEVPEPVSDVVLTSQAEVVDLKAEIAAARAEVAGLRADFRALMKAIEAGGQLRLFPVAA